MSQLDIVILSILALGGLRGLLRGLIKEAATLAAFVLGGWLAFRLHEQAALLLSPMVPLAAARMIAFVTLLILVGLASHLLSNLLTRLVSLALLGWVNRVGGLLLGGLEGALVLGMVFYALLTVPLSFPFKESIRQHAFAAQLAQLGGTALDQAKSLKQLP